MNQKASKVQDYIPFICINFKELKRPQTKTQSKDYSCQHSASQYRTCYADQAGLTLRALLVLKACAIKPGSTNTL